MKLIKTASGIQLDMKKSEWLQIGRAFRTAQETEIEQVDEVAELDSELADVGNQPEEQTNEEKEIEEKSDEIRIEDSKESLMTTDLDDLNKAMFSELSKYQSFLPDDIKQIFMGSPEGKVALTEFMTNFNPQTDTQKFNQLNSILEGTKERYNQSVQERRQQSAQWGVD